MLQYYSSVLQSTPRPLVIQVTRQILSYSYGWPPHAFYGSTIKTHHVFAASLATRRYEVYAFARGMTYSGTVLQNSCNSPCIERATHEGARLDSCGTLHHSFIYTYVIAVHLQREKLTQGFVFARLKTEAAHQHPSTYKPTLHCRNYMPLKTQHRFYSTRCRHDTLARNNVVNRRDQIAWW